MKERKRVEENRMWASGDGEWHSGWECGDGTSMSHSGGHISKFPPAAILDWNDIWHAVIPFPWSITKSLLLWQTTVPKIMPYLCNSSWSLPSLWKVDWNIISLGAKCSLPTSWQTGTIIFTVSMQCNNEASGCVGISLICRIGGGVGVGCKSQKYHDTYRNIPVSQYTSLQTNCQKNCCILK